MQAKRGWRGDIDTCGSYGMYVYPLFKQGLVWPQPGDETVDCCNISALGIENTTSLKSSGEILQNKIVYTNKKAKVLGVH